MRLFQRRGLTRVSLLVLCAVHCARAFNLDVRFPVVKEGQTAGSLFGLSVALHEQVEGEKRYMILVGAPKEKAEPKLQANETGDMYACPITVDPKDCKRQYLITSDKEDIPDPKNDVLEGMWLGVSVASQSQPGGRVMACGHRYVRNMTSNLRMIGKCYIRGNNLKYNGADSWQQYNEVCSPTGSLDDEGMCLAGISSAFTQSDVILGTPGCYNWQGNTFSFWHDPKDDFGTVRSKFDNTKRGNIYIGYSVVMDKDILNKEKETVVTGAPRDEAKGSVMLAESFKIGGTEGLIKSNINLAGEQVGSYFGNSIAALDLNNDGWKDLVVGAPFYFDRKNEKGGAVYIYMNQNGFFHNKADVVLTGPKNSAFGMAVAAIGDVNQDGFQDFAVGAPYEGSGSVYVWMGSKTGISNKPSQVINGTDITGGGFQTFGYSISGGVDVDSNSYPDIVVGSLDERVVLLRARPVIHVKKTFTVTPGVIDPNDCDSCIEAKFCLSYTPSTGSTSSQKSVTFKYKVEADLLHRSPRVRFLDNNADTMSVASSDECRSMKLELVSRTIQDKVAPIVFLLNVSLVEPRPSAGKSLEDLSAFPVISQGNVLTSRTEIHIQKACGPDNKCESNLQMTAVFTDEQNKPFPTKNGRQMFSYTTDVKKLRLVVNVTNVPSEGRMAENAYSALLNVTIPASLSFSSLSPKNLNVEVPSSDVPFLLCSLGDPFKGNHWVEITITFETTGITIDTPEILTELQLSTRSDQNDLRPLSRELEVEYTLQPTFSIAPALLRTEFSGTVVGESAIKTTSDIGSPLEFNFTVNLSGKPLGNLGVLEMVFQWPYEVASGKHLLYLSEIQTIGTSQSVCVPKNAINFLNLTVSERKSGRQKRDEGSIESEHAEPQASPNTRAVQRKPVTLDCVKGSAHCLTFTCPLLDMKTSATLTVRARLWNSTMLEDYVATTVVVHGNVTLSLKTDKPTIKMVNATREFTVVIDPALTEELPYETPLWIIIVSVLAGVILLSLIVVLLWKCGFFKRANTRELYEAKAQKAEMKTQPSENDRLTEED